MGLFGRPRKQSKDGKLRQSNLILTSEVNPSSNFSVSGCDMIEIPPGIYNKCHNLRKKVLDLSNNRLHDLGDEDLELLCGLEELNISGNNFKTLPVDVEKLTNLRAINASKNPKFSDVASFAKLHSLEEVNIRDTLIKVCPESWSDLKYLRKVELSEDSHLPKGSIDKATKHIINLEVNPSEEIIISHCNLWTIPPNLYFKSNNLRKSAICLNNNHLIEIENNENSLEHLVGIEQFDLSCNCISSLPSSISFLKALVHLNVSNNYICNLPLALFQLENLRILNVDFNPIENIPNEIMQLKELEEFTCTNTYVEGLPESESLKTFLLALTCFLSDFIPSNSTKSPISHLSLNSSRERSRKGSKVVDIFALNEEREKQQLLASELSRMEDKANTQKARMILEEEAAKEKAAQIRAKEDDALQNISSIARNQELENQHFFDELDKRRKELENFTKKMIEKQEKQNEDDILEFLRRNEQEEKDYFKVTEEQMKTVDQEYLKHAMKHLFEENQKFNMLYEQLQADDAAMTAKIKEHLANEKLPLLSENLDPKGLEEMEMMQKMAVQKLLENQDTELIQIRNYALKVEKELIELTRLEQKRRIIESEETHDWLEERRLELSELLGTFLKQEREREEMAKDLLVKMNRQREQDQAMFWLVQFQRLLDEKPLALRKMESYLEPDLASLLMRACVGEGVIEAFATHRISYLQLHGMKDDDLKRIGIKSIGDRERILTEVVNGPPAVSKGSAPTLNQIESNHIQPAITVTHPSPAVSPTAPSDLPVDPFIGRPASPNQQTIETREDEECCICMDARPSVVYLPCGHVCACSECSRTLTACPLCRVEICQKIIMYR